MGKPKKSRAPKRAARAPAKSGRRERVQRAADKGPIPERPPPAVATADGWVDAGKGYQLALDGGKLAARNAAGKRLASVPKELRDGEVGEQLEALRDWLIEHDRACTARVEQWMLRSLPVPRAVLQAVWEDEAWRGVLENAVIEAPYEPRSGEVRTRAGGAKRSAGPDASAGLFRGVDPKRGVGVVDIDGETAWLAAESVAIPHPILIPELDAWRELVTQLGVAQGVPQLHRETYAKPPSATGAAIDQFEDGKFAMLMHAVGKARALGYKVRGGFATCKVWDGDAVSEARYWIGADSPDAETYTGALLWVDERERVIPLAGVGPVAFSEGMRMASAIYAARAVEKKEPA